jgi:hypothetical protein
MEDVETNASVVHSRRLLRDMVQSDNGAPSLAAQFRMVVDAHDAGQPKEVLRWEAWLEDHLDSQVDSPPQILKPTPSTLGCPESPCTKQRCSWPDASPG